MSVKSCSCPLCSVTQEILKEFFMRDYSTCGPILQGFRGGLGGMPGFRAGQLTYVTRRFNTWHQCRRRTKGQLTYGTVLIERDTACIARGSVSV